MSSTPRIPPRFVPTLTSVIGPFDTRAEMALDFDSATHGIDEENVALEEELMHRILERVDRSLENELSDVVAASVQAQLDVMVPKLRSEIEKVVRRLVTDALSRELAENPGSTLA